MGLNHRGTVELETDRLCLRPFYMQDASSFFQHITHDNKVRRYFLIPYHETLKQTELMMRRIVHSYDQSTYHWAITLKDNDQMIGLVRLFEVDEVNSSAEIGYALSEDYWNNGYMSEAILAIIEYLFKIVSYKTLTADCMIENLASHRILEKIGMKIVGKTTKGIIWQGNTHDVLHYSLTTKEFLNSNEK